MKILNLLLLVLTSLSTASVFAQTANNGSYLIPRAESCDTSRLEDLFVKGNKKPKKPFGSGHPWPGVYGTWIDMDRCAFITIKNQIDETGSFVSVRILDIENGNELAFGRHYYDPDMDEETPSIVIPVERHKFLTKGNYYFEIFSENKASFQGRTNALFVTVWKKTPKLTVIRDRFTFKRLTQR